MICKDPYAIHRKWWDPYWIPDPIADTAWTDWDYLLLEVHQAIETYTSDKSGQPRWLAEDPDVYWDTEMRFDYADATVQRATEGMKEMPPGASIYPVKPYKRDGGEFWTVRDWLESLSREQPMEQGAPRETGRPPTPEELQAIRERKRQKRSQ